MLGAQGEQALLHLSHGDLGGGALLLMLLPLLLALADFAFGLIHARLQGMDKAISSLRLFAGALLSQLQRLNFLLDATIFPATERDLLGQPLAFLAVLSDS